MRYFLELSYHGRGYSGFQVQENAHTVQAEVERALATVFRENIELTGSSRTDAGVHARQNYFHFDSPQEISQKAVYNLNAVLPADVAVTRIYPMPPDAHCRFDAVAREYRYYIHFQKDPFRSDRSWQYPYPLAQPLLDHAAAILAEYRDFTSFSKRNTQVKTFDCEILSSAWHRNAYGLEYHVSANRFLRGMVRGLVGTMLRMGRGMLDEQGFRAIIEDGDNTRADFSTPAHGLFLHRVVYRKEIADVLEMAAG